MLKKMSEDNKIAIRNIRRDAIDDYKTKQKNSEITEDDLHSAEEDIQKLTDKYIGKIESVIDAKEKEIMSL